MLVAFGALALLFVLIVVLLLAVGMRPRRASRKLGDGRGTTKQSMNSSSSSL
jgi:hypothetical protein